MAQYQTVARLLYLNCVDWQCSWPYGYYDLETSSSELPKFHPATLRRCYFRLKCWAIVNRVPWNKLQQNTKLFISENESENTVVILPRQLFYLGTDEWTTLHHKTRLRYDMGILSLLLVHNKGEFNGYAGFPWQRTNNTELWRFLYWFEQTQTHTEKKNPADLPMVWDAMTRTLYQCNHCNGLMYVVTSWLDSFRMLMWL